MVDSDMFMNILELKHLWFLLMWNNMAHSILILLNVIPNLVVFLYFRCTMNIHCRMLKVDLYNMISPWNFIKRACN